MVFTMNRFLDMLPRAIRFKWKTAVQPTLGRLSGATDKPTDFSNDESLLCPTPASDFQPPKTQKISSPTTFCIPKLLSTNKQGWQQDPNFYRWPFSLSRTFGVIGWGTVLAFGLQLNKNLWRLKNNNSNSERSWLEYVTFALPLNRSAILEFDQKSSHNSLNEFKPEEFSASKQEAPETFDDKLITIVDKCVAIGQNIDGIQSAATGNYQDAVKHWKQSSSLGHSKSSFNLGLCYEMGKGVTKNLVKAMKYYQVAVDQNHRQAMYNLALLYLNPEKSTTNPQFPIAINLLERAAKLGLPQAQTYLGVIYADGDETNFSKAIEMFTAAAEQQDNDALYYLGVCFESGLGVNQSESNAAEYFVKAANAGHSEAQYCLANYYEQGLGGLLKDDKLAQEFYQKAAKAGHENAQQRLQEISYESSQNTTEKIMGTTCSVSALNSIEKVSQVATILSNSFSSMFTNSVLALKASLNNSTENPVNVYLRDNFNGLEEQLDNHLQFMPHCCTNKDLTKSTASIRNEVLCS